MPSSGQDFSGVDELLDFSNDRGDLFCSSATDILHQHHNLTPSSTASGCHFQYGVNNNEHYNNGSRDIATTYHHHLPDFTDELCVPSDDVAELEWLSNFVHDSFSDFPANNLAGTINYRPENASFHSRSRSKRTRSPTDNTSWKSKTPLPTASISERTTMKLEAYSSPTSSLSDTTSEAGIVRRCTHCASEKTPQWRTGPLGPKTLCNACGVRYKSGRLVPEYRPAASPTFVEHASASFNTFHFHRFSSLLFTSPIINQKIV
ncbi:hypothetical protein L2E82_43104 [Cichorium intybus]|uniref:Uncharacterized protein n=1 Tax=Cichorium intybus TaxID=13427 RepID=A0ACB8ZMY6_CICIN|nr:hypothetical protein L2E82_43104 [Cichorium intybus]